MHCAAIWACCAGFMQFGLQVQLEALVVLDLLAADLEVERVPLGVDGAREHGVERRTELLAHVLDDYRVALLDRHAFCVSWRHLDRALRRRTPDRLKEGGARQALGVLQHGRRANREVAAVGRLDVARDDGRGDGELRLGAQRCAAARARGARNLVKYSLRVMNDVSARYVSASHCAVLLRGARRGRGGVGGARARARAQAHGAQNDEGKLTTLS